MTIFARDIYSYACDLDLYISGYIKAQTPIESDTTISFL